VDDKSNEITAIPQLIRVLVLKGCIVTIDAMGCQTDIAKLIVEAEADYVLALKANQGTLHQQVQDSFEREMPTHTYTELSAGHGRVEKRTYSVLTDLKWVENVEAWSGLQTLIRVQSEVFQKLSQKATRETRYYISSIQIIDKESDSKKLAQAIRSHWGIEVCLHWSLDVTAPADRF
jgi:predicted transposase YbfD/YdcC